MSLTAVRMLLRDWRGGELGVLVAALVLAVGVVAGISAFTTRLQHALQQESHRFLAADAVVRGGQPLPGDWLQQATENGLRHARTLSFPSMIYAGETQMVLASVRAVSAGYPLRGELTRSEVPFAEPTPAAHGPAAGEIWLDSRLFALLEVTVGDTVAIGDASLRVVAALRTEPDQASSFIGSYAPRVLMHVDDIAATGVVQPGSRVEYRQLFAGSPEDMAAFIAWLRPRLADGQSLVGVDEDQPGIGSALQRAESFLLLAGSLAVVLAGVAVALAARRFSERHTDYVAILKSLGAGSARINRLYGGSLLLLGLLATVAGCALGWALQAVFFALFAEQLPVQPAASGPRPYLIGAATALVCLLCFAWPPLLRLGRASPLRVLRRDLPAENRRTAGDYLLGFAALALLMWWYSGDVVLTSAVLAGLIVTGVCGLLLALVLLRGGRLLGMRAGSIWRLALAGLQRRGAANAAQVVIFAMAIMLLLLITLVRTSLIDAWQTQLPADAPNHFVINIAPEERDALAAALAAEGLRSEPLYPMVRGRVMAVNGVALPTGDEASDEQRQRESNFTWSAVLPPENTLVAGRWWPEGSRDALVSVEQGFAADLGIQLGDELELLVGADPLRARVASIRALQWQSLRPNFFLVFTPGLLGDYPATYMTSFHLGAGDSDKLALNRLVRQFPTVTVIEMDMVIAQIRNIISQVSSAIELVLLVILATGALVLVAGVQASVDARVQESAILRALGARRGLLLGGLLIEFATLGLCAGVLASAAAELSAWVLATRVLAMDYTPSPWLWLVGIGIGTALIAVLGVFSCRRVVAAPPVVVLREL